MHADNFTAAIRQMQKHHPDTSGMGTYSKGFNNTAEASPPPPLFFCSPPHTAAASAVPCRSTIPCAGRLWTEEGL